MKNTLFLALFVIGCSNLIYGQSTVAENPLGDLDKFKLGDSVSKFGQDIKLTPNSPSELRSYQYLPSLKEPVEIDGIKFKIIVLCFDEKDRLKTVQYTEFFPENTFKKQSRRDYKQLTAYVAANLKKAGEKKVFYPKVHEGHEWVVGDGILTVGIQKTQKRESTSVGISLSREKNKIFSGKSKKN